MLVCLYSKLTDHKYINKKSLLNKKLIKKKWLGLEKK